MSTLAKLLAASSLIAALSVGAQAETVKPMTDAYGNPIVQPDPRCAVQPHIGCPGYIIVGVGY